MTHSFGQAAGRGYQPGRGSEGSMDFPDISAIGNEDLPVFSQDFQTVHVSCDITFHQLDLVISGASCILMKVHVMIHEHKLCNK